jgi:hypothetical protein
MEDMFITPEKDDRKRQDREHVAKEGAQDPKEGADG